RTYTTARRAAAPRLWLASPGAVVSDEGFEGGMLRCLAEVLTLVSLRPECAVRPPQPRAGVVHEDCASRDVAEVLEVLLVERHHAWVGVERRDGVALAVCPREEVQPAFVR